MTRLKDRNPLILVYSATTESTIESSLGVSEYSYYFVLKMFLPALQQLAEVRQVTNPLSEVDTIYDQCESEGRYCVFLSFCPPQFLELELRCPTIPVFAWEFENIPDEMWDNNPKTDWRHVLGRTGWAITHSSHTVKTVQDNLRAGYPIVSAPAPLWDHFAHNGIPRRGPSIDQPFSIAVEQGYIVDTDQIDLQQFSPQRRDHSAVPPPLSRETLVELDGVIYTSVLNPRDGRKNWMDLIWTFCWAMKDNADATLVLKLTCTDVGELMEVLLEDLYKLTPFQCRVVAIGGYLPDREYERLAANSTYAVNASHGEGQCLPLMEYMSCGTPAISPRHTGLLDYISEDNAFIAESSLEPSHWPQDPRQYYRTLRHRLDWESMLGAYLESYRVVKERADQYRQMSLNAIETLEKHCSEKVVSDTLQRFLELHLKQLDDFSRPG